MFSALKSPNFSCITSYALEALASINVNRIEPFFEGLPVDPYLEGNYRFRCLSNFEVSDNRLIKLPHSRFFQSKSDNPLLGDVVREYPELDEELIELEDFQRLVLEFFEFCKLCSTSNQIGAHQIRIASSSQHMGSPAPEGIHRDGVDVVGIFCVHREGIEGGETHLYKSKDDRPIFNKILNPGEFLVFSDRQFFHFTSPIKAISSGRGIRDVFVFTCPGLAPKSYSSR